MTEKRAIIVSGAASGLGRATVQSLAGHGRAVAAVDRNGIDATALPKGCRAYVCDVTDAAAVDKLCAEVVDDFGGVAGLVNCAGIVQGGKLVSRKGPHDPELFRRVLEVNTVGTFNLMRAAAMHMQSAPPDQHGQRGAIVNTSSIAAFDGQIGQMAYAASKGAVAAMTLPVARELAQHGIRVVAIAPGVFDTPMMAGMAPEVREALEETIPFPPKLADPADFGALVHHIFQNPTLNGEVIRLDGALRMAPR